MAHSLLDQATSSTVEAYRAYQIGDEADNKWSLFVEFKSGSIYRYIVPFSVCLDMKDATSLGKFVNLMKIQYHGIPVSPQTVTDLIESAAAVALAAKQRKARVKKLSASFFSQYPQLSYFF